MRSKQFLTIGIGFLAFLFIFIPSTYAEDGQTFEVGTSSLNVREAPSHDADVLGQLTKGDQVVVFKEAFGWAQTYYDGQVAWVASHFLIPKDTVKQESVTSQKSITVTANEVRIRTGPGTVYNIIGATSSGDTFDLIETSNDWHKIALRDGSTGWIAAWLTDTNTNANTQPAENTNDNDQVAGVTSNSLEGSTIVLDPGHGGKDPGAIGIDGVFEKDLIMVTAENVAQKLRAAGATVILTRTDDYFVPLDERVRISGAYNTDAFISLHYNAFPLLNVQGINTYYYSYGEDRELAQEIQASISQRVNMVDRGISQADYHVLRKNSDLAVLLELGFITNPYDLSAIRSDSYQNSVADGIVEGLKNYFHK